MVHWLLARLPRNVVVGLFTVLAVLLIGFGIWLSVSFPMAVITVVVGVIVLLVVISVVTLIWEQFDKRLPKREKKQSDS